MKPSVSFSVGRLLCRQVREFLASMKFQGYDIDWIESTGWIERTFTVKGSDDALEVLAESMLAFKARLDKTRGNTP